MSARGANLNQKTSREENSLGTLLNGNLKILSDLVTALSAVGDDLYRYQPSPDVSSIGMHVRHVIEFYQEFLRAMDGGDVCYDNRQRDLKFEISKDKACDQIKKISSIFRTSDLCDRDLVLSVVTSPEGPLSHLHTTLQRELYHVLDHCVHHMALIKMLGARHGVEFDVGFGLANATKKHLNG